jgi:hypothetical protein
MRMAGDSVAKVKRKAKIACDEQATVSDLEGAEVELAKHGSVGKLPKFVRRVRDQPR